MTLFLVSCGMDIDVPNTSHEVEVQGDIGPDFEKTAIFCDNRYQDDPDKAEECFMDFREFYSVEVKLNLDSIEEFCDNNYNSEKEIKGCKEELLSFLGNMGEK